MLVVHEQTVLLQKARKQHAVPVFVSDFGDKLVDGLLTVNVFAVTSLAAMGAQAGTQLALFITQVVGRFGITYTQTF